jgi:hypothetical protein
VGHQHPELFESELDTLRDKELEQLLTLAQAHALRLHRFKRCTITHLEELKRLIGPSHFIEQEQKQLLAKLCAILLCGCDSPGHSPEEELVCRPRHSSFLRA